MAIAELFWMDRSIELSAWQPMGFSSGWPCWAVMDLQRKLQDAHWNPSELLSFSEVLESLGVEFDAVMGM